MWRDGGHFFAWGGSALVVVAAKSAVWPLPRSCGVRWGRVSTVLSCRVAGVESSLGRYGSDWKSGAEVDVDLDAVYEEVIGKVETDVQTEYTSGYDTVGYKVSERFVPSEVVDHAFTLINALRRGRRRYYTVLGKCTAATVFPGDLDDGALRRSRIFPIRNRFGRGKTEWVRLEEFEGASLNDVWDYSERDHEEFLRIAGVGEVRVNGRALPGVAGGWDPAVSMRSWTVWALTTARLFGVASSVYERMMGRISGGSLFEWLCARVVPWQQGAEMSIELPYEVYYLCDSIEAVLRSLGAGVSYHQTPQYNDVDGDVTTMVVRVPAAKRFDGLGSLAEEHGIDAQQELERRWAADGSLD